MADIETALLKALSTITPEDYKEWISESGFREWIVV